jgi:hypothetical protein
LNTFLPNVCPSQKNGNNIKYPKKIAKAIAVIRKYLHDSCKFKASLNPLASVAIISAPKPRERSKTNMTSIILAPARLEALASKYRDFGGVVIFVPTIINFQIP